MSLVLFKYALIHFTTMQEKLQNSTERGANKIIKTMKVATLSIIYLSNLTSESKWFNNNDLV